MNAEIADSLREIAALLEKQQANHFRVNAYRRAAQTLESLQRSASDIVADKGVSGLVALPGIGDGIARSIYEYVATGRMSRLETLRGEHDPIRLFERIPGVGPVLAAEIHHHLHVDTLEALEVAARSGRLQKLKGIGKGRAESIQAWLASVLGRRRQRLRFAEPIEAPTVSMLLDVDRRYRESAIENKLPKIAPKRFNPAGEAWLPILHTVRGKWHFTALYSNTQRAHDLGRTGDWVVIYFYDERHHEGQHTIVTEHRGDLSGKRVARGRESECRDYYARG